MKIRVGLAAPVAIVMALAVAACSSGTPTIAIPGLGGATLAPRQTVAAGTSCAGYPSIWSIASPQPTIPVDAVDAALLGTFPLQVAGQPISDPQANLFLGLMCYTVGQGGVDQMGQETSVLGVNIANMSFGGFVATINDNSVGVIAIRTPGQDAGQLLRSFGLLAGILGIAGVNRLSGSSTDWVDANVGGKNVRVVTDAEYPESSVPSKSWFYAHGDTLWMFVNVTDAEATAILIALP